MTVSTSSYGVGFLPVASQPWLSLTHGLMFPLPAYQPYGDVQELLARRTHLDHALASLVSFLFYFFLYNTLGVAMTLCIAHTCLPSLDVAMIYFVVWPNIDIFLYKCCDYL